MLFLGTDTETLAQHLARSLQEGRQDPFEPVTIVVPNPHLGKWLRLTLARQLGVVMNLSFRFVEQALWDMFAEVDPRAGGSQSDTPGGQIREHASPIGSGPRARMPAGRWGEPDDAARLVAWLCSTEAGWITGQTIDSEGGFRRSA